MITNTTLVFSADVARKLLKAGYQIVDIRPDKMDPDNKKSIFVFRNDFGLDEAIQKLVQNRR